jgi:hypothetical protein
MTRFPAALRGVAATLLMLPAACAGKVPASQPAGVLTIGVSTTGAGASTLTFGVDVAGSRPDGAAPESDRVKADGGIATFRDLPAGAYVVRLALPAGCQAAGGASRPLTIAASRTTAVRFVVRCQ